MTDQSDRPAVWALTGRSGTGKTSTAEALRDALGLPVLELGPLFRYAALLSSTRGLVAAGLEIERRVCTGELVIDPWHSAAFAASRLIDDDRHIDDELWSPRLAEEIVAASEHPSVVRSLLSAALELTTGLPGPWLVTGRDATHLLGDRTSRLELTAAAEVRRARKGEQLALRSDQSAELFEPRVSALTGPRRLDTSDMSLVAVRRAALDAFARDLLSAA